MLIFERLDPQGQPVAMHLERDGDELVLIRGATRAALPGRVLIAILRRYGRELDPLVTLDPDSVDLGDGAKLHRFRFHARVDAEGRDYLALVETGQPAIGAMATTIAGALEHLMSAR